MTKRINKIRINDKAPRKIIINDHEAEKVFRNEDLIYARSTLPPLDFKLYQENNGMYSMYSGFRGDVILNRFIAQPRDPGVGYNIYVNIYDLLKHEVVYTIQDYRQMTQWVDDLYYLHSVSGDVANIDISVVGEDVNITKTDFNGIFKPSLNFSAETIDTNLMLCPENSNSNGFVLRYKGLILKIKLTDTDYDIGECRYITPLNKGQFIVFGATGFILVTGLNKVVAEDLLNFFGSSQESEITLSHALLNNLSIEKNNGNIINSSEWNSFSQKPTVVDSEYMGNPVKVVNFLSGSNSVVLTVSQSNMVNSEVFPMEGFNNYNHATFVFFANKKHNLVCFGGINQSRIRIAHEALRAPEDDLYNFSLLSNYQSSSRFICESPDGEHILLYVSGASEVLKLQEFNVEECRFEDNCNLDLTDLIGDGRYGGAVTNIRDKNTKGHNCADNSIIVDSWDNPYNYYVKYLNNSVDNLYGAVWHHNFKDMPVVPTAANGEVVISNSGHKIKAIKYPTANSANELTQATDGSLFFNGTGNTTSAEFLMAEIPEVSSVKGITIEYYIKWNVFAQYKTLGGLSYIAEGINATMGLATERNTLQTNLHYSLQNRGNSNLHVLKGATYPGPINFSDKDNYHHIVLRYQENIVYVFIDGAKYGPFNPSVLPVDIANVLIIGTSEFSQTSGWNIMWNGNLLFIGVYDYLLSDENIAKRNEQLHGYY